MPDHRKDGTARTIAGLTGNMRHVLDMMARGLPYGSAATKATWNALMSRGLVALGASGGHVLTEKGKDAALRVTRTDAA